MKKGKLKVLIVLVLIAIVFMGYFLIQKIRKEKRKYDVEEISEYKYFVVKEDNKYGVIDSTGNKIIETDYDDVKIPNPQRDIFICYQNGSINIFNKAKEEKFKEYEKVEPLRLKNISSDLMYEKTVLKYTQNGKYGIIDFNGKKVTKAIYDEIDTLEYKEGELLVSQNGKYGVINIKGTLLVKMEYDKIESDKYYQEKDGYKSSGYIVCNRTDEGYRYGYINVDGKKIVDTNFNELCRVIEINSEDVYIICAENGKYGLLKNNKKIIENEYQSLTYIESNKRLIAQKGKKQGVLTLDGKIIVPFEYNQIYISGKNIYAMTNNEEIKVLDENGNETNINENLIIINEENSDYEIHIETANEKTTYSIYKDNNKLTKKEYIYIKYLFDNYFIACYNDNKLGIINDKEEIKLEYIYSSIQKIEDTNMLLAINSNTNITEIYSHNLKKICELKDGNIKNNKEYIKLYNTEETKYISKEGKEIKNTDVFPNNKIFAKKNSNGKWGFVDKNGKTVLNFTYDKVTEINKYGFAGIKVGNKWGIVNSEGKIIVKPTYELSSDEPEFIGEYYQVIYGNGEIYYTK